MIHSNTILKRLSFSKEYHRNKTPVPPEMENSMQLPTTTDRNLQFHNNRVEERGKPISRLQLAYRIQAMLAVLTLGLSALFAQAAEVTLYDGGTPPTIFHAPQGGTPIAKVADLLARDLTALTGQQPVVTSKLHEISGTAIIIGQIDTPSISALLRENHIDTEVLRGKWETYGRTVIPAPWNPEDRAILIFGSDTRGTIWGVMDLTREMGVSPWEWWADVTIQRRNRIEVDAGLHFSKEPSVKYRGIFLNAGSNGMNPWAGKTYDPAVGNMGPKTYARIFELLWRLKANAIWPAMTNVDLPFNAFEDNYRAAADYAIVRGSSHVEMLLRTNPTEWDEDERGPYNWITNREEMIRYWTESVHKFGKYENLYTVGLRNRDDFPMQGVDTPEAMADVLRDVITEQRRILSTELGKPADQIPQIFTLYKEVLVAYDTGRIDLPDDITNVWPDDNFAHNRRLSSPTERQRSGGSGIYFHDVFWGPPNAYLWLQTTNPYLMWTEMSKAWQFGARNFWMLNVGSIKPGEFLTELYLSLAYDIEAFGDGDAVRSYMRDWSARNFGEEHADRITTILSEFYRLAFSRYPEYMGWTEVFPETAIRQTEFNMLDFGDENARRVAAYEAIVKDAAAIAAELPDDLKPAFFQLVQYQVNGAAYLNQRQLFLDKTITYGLQHRASANVYSNGAREAQAGIIADTAYYNETMLNGKWRHMVDPMPHPLPIFEVPHYPTWDDNGDRKCGVQVEGGAYFDEKDWWTPDLPTFHPELRESYYIDVFTQGAFDGDWQATATEPINAFRQDTLRMEDTTPVSWIKLSQADGRFSVADQHFEDRILVSIDWDKAPAAGRAEVIITGSHFIQPIAVHIHLAPANPNANVSFIEANRTVSIYATHTDARSDDWEVINGFGHTGASLRTRLDMSSIDPFDEAAIKSAPYAEYRFATTNMADRATLRAIAIPTFPITTANGVRIAASIDGGPLHIPDFLAPEFTARWRQHALSNKAIEEIINLRLSPGTHTLRVYALDPGVTLDRFEIAFDGASRAYDPIPETKIRR